MPKTDAIAAPVAKATSKAAARLGSKERRELEALPGKIEKLEAEQAQLSELIGDPAVYQRDKDRALAAQTRLAAIEDELAKAYARWESLEGLH